MCGSGCGSHTCKEGADLAVEDLSARAGLNTAETLRAAHQLAKITSKITSGWSVLLSLD